MAKQNKPIAGMFLWEVEIEYWGFTSMTRRTLTIATRRKVLTDAQKKAGMHLKAFRYDYPKSKIIGLTYSGFIDA
jgi:hypothetical protein